MHHNNSIKYLTHQQIDKEKWDAVIASSPNGLIYGFSFYLDHMAEQWDALVLNDYEAVMPLTWKKKYGIYYLYQPFLCASLGIFGDAVSEETTKAFLLNIPAKFSYIDISLNHGNLFKTPPAGISERKNYVLDLNASYNTIYNAFSENVKRNIKKAAQNGCIVTRPAFTEVLALAKIQLKQTIEVSENDFSLFLKLYNYLEKKNAAITYGITAADGKLIASCAFFKWQNRAYYILVGNDTRSKGTGASHALINEFIKDHEASNLVLDFEGSDVPGPAMFYKSFGAIEENYPAFKSNRLPFFLKWLKK